MEINNELIRTELKKYLDDRGTKARWVANKVSLSDTSISLFLSNERNLTEEYLIKIYNLINS